MIEVAGMHKHRFEKIITYLCPPITNPTNESTRSKVRWVKYAACGFRNKQKLVSRDLLGLRRLD